MKFTSIDLMKAMGLSVGDRVKVICVDNNFTATDETYEIKQGAGDTYLQSIDDGFIDSLAYLIDQDIEILPRPKRVGDLKCVDIPHSNCIICPIKILCLDYGNADNQPFYEILEDYKSKSGEHFDQEIYDLLKSRLDKEVE